MSEKEIYEKYIEENCKRCKNRKTNKCSITISIIEQKAKCDSYEKEY